MKQDKKESNMAQIIDHNIRIKVLRGVLESVNNRLDYYHMLINKSNNEGIKYGSKKNKTISN